MKVEDYLIKTPFVRPMPLIDWAAVPTDGTAKTVPLSKAQFVEIPQDVFLTELDPSGHRINDTYYYPDRIKEDDQKQKYIHFVERCAFPIQSIITTKQVTHLSGNQINFVSAEVNPSEESKLLMLEYKQAWLLKNMEVALYESYYMEKTTGDTALCGYIENGVFGWRTFGYANGETLYPSYNERTGKMDAFARRYVSKGQEKVDIVDNTYLTTYRRSDGFTGALPQNGAETGWAMESRHAHGFKRLPVAYKRSRFGACWSLVQDCIDKLELAVSQLCENNKAYAFRILFLKGEDIDVKHNVDGMPSAITGDNESDARFLEKADASTSFQLQLDTLLKMIFMGSFTVLPPEIKGGDLPGVTIKILYSPAVEKAMEDARQWNSFVDDVVEIFKEGYGIESVKVAQFKALKIRGEIVPYVHQNELEVVNNLNSSITMGSLSTETAAELHPYAKNDEYNRITAQQEQQQEREQQQQLAVSALKKEESNATNNARKLAGA